MISQSNFTGAITASRKQKKAQDTTALASKLKQIDVAEFEFDERTKFENKVSEASASAQGGTAWGAGLGGLAAGVIGLTAAPAALLVGGASLALGKATSYGHKKNLQDSQYYKRDAGQAVSGIDKQIWADSIMSGLMAASAAGKAKSMGGEELVGEATEEATKGAVETAGKEVTEEI